MYKSNYHCHSLFCDGRAPLEDFAKEAVKRGLKSLGFSAHAPIPFYTDWHMSHEKMQDYLHEIERLKELYKDKLEIYTGLEVDYLGKTQNASIPYFQNLPTDYLISSIHFLSNKEGGEYMPIDNSFEEFKWGVENLFDGNLKKTIEEFFFRSLNMVEIGGFKIVGHIDKIQQNGYLYPNFNSYQEVINRYMKELFFLIKEKDLIVEINTKSYRKLRITYPDVKWFSFMKSLNIPIQVNSDSHDPYLLEDSFEDIFPLLRRAGFTHTCERVGGKWQEISL